MRKIGIIIVAIGFCLLKPLAFSQVLEIQDPNRALRAQIILQNLIIGLSLDKAQMRTIISEAQKLKNLEENICGNIEANLASQTEALQALKEETKKDIPQISKDIAHQIHQKKVSSLKLHKDYVDTLKNATKKVKGLLNDGQIYIIETFHPCLIPPKGSGRVGQDTSDGGSGTRLLERVRKMPNRRYQTLKNTIIDKLLERASLMYPRDVNEDNLPNLQSQILAIVEETRNLSDFEFAVYKNEKGKAIKNLIKPQKEKVAVDKRIAKFLLNPEIIPVLKEQLSRDN